MFKLQSQSVTHLSVFFGGESNSRLIELMELAHQENFSHGTETAVMDSVELSSSPTLPERLVLLKLDFKVVPSTEIIIRDNNSPKMLK